VADQPDAGAGPADGGGWRDAWASALDDLELSVAEGERILNGEQIVAPTPWTPPVIEAPLPADMLERAQALLGRQRQLIDRTSAAMSGHRQRIDLVGKLSSSNTVVTGRPVYVDLTA